LLRAIGRQRGRAIPFPPLRRGGQGLGGGCFCCARSEDSAAERSLSPPCEGGVRGGGPGIINYKVFKGASSGRLVATLGNDLETRPNTLKTRGKTALEIVADSGCKGGGKPFTVSEACVPTPSGCPPLPLVTLHSLSTPPGPPFARGGKGSVARAVVRSRATKTRVSKSSLQYGQHQLFITPGLG